MHKCLQVAAAAAMAAACAVLVGCATSEKSLADQGMKPLSEADLKALYSRTRTLKWTNANNNAGTAEHKADGTSQVQWSGGSASGTYRIVGPTFCAQYPNVRGGVEYCMRVYKVADNKYTTFLVNGEPNSTYSFTN